jgi:hypothetical protein
MTRKEIEKLADDIKTLERAAAAPTDDRVLGGKSIRFLSSVVARLAKLILPEGY